MPRSIIDIDVKDEKFKRFLDLYQQYQDQLKKMPAAWREAADAAAGAGAATADTAAALAASAASTALIAEALEGAEISAARATDTMGKMAEHARSVAGSIFHATRDLAKWATFSLGAGLIGGGLGLFGIDALANVVSGQRKSAQGLGIPTAEQQAFNVNFGSRLVGADFLSGIQGVKSDLGQQWQFAALGIGADDVQRGDTAQLGIDVIRRARDLWQQAGPQGRNSQWMQAHGLTGFMDFATWQRIGQASAGDLANFTAQYARDVPTMGASDKTQVDWQDFAIQMKRAADQIEAVFVNGLNPLIPSLTKLSVSVEKALAEFLGNPHLEDWIKGFAKAISAFGDYLGSDKFSNDVRAFVDDIAYAADKLKRDFQFLGLLPPDEVPAQNNAANPALPNPDQRSLRQKLFAPESGWDFSGIEKTNNLPAGFLSALGMEESSLNPAAQNTKNGITYKGLFQLGPGVIHDYGVTAPFDPTQNANAAGMEMRDYITKYHGNIAESIAAENWGPGNLDKDIAAHGKDWLRHAPSETQRLIQRIADRLHVTITVLNQTGAQVAMIANATQQ